MNVTSDLNHEEPDAIWEGEHEDASEAGDDDPLEGVSHDSLIELQVHYDNVAAIEDPNVRFAAAKWVHAALAGL